MKSSITSRSPVQKSIKRKSHPHNDEDNPKIIKLNYNDGDEVIQGLETGTVYSSQSPVMLSTRKRKTSPHRAEENLKSINFDVDNCEESVKSLDTDINYSNVSTYHKGGLVHSLHGNIYQLKLLMLFLKRALDKGYEFQLGTEVEDAEKFDDIALKYKIILDEIRLVQVKHKQNESKKITANDILNLDNGDFSLQKYFISYCKIKRNPMFSKLKDVILYTNIDFDLANLEQASIKVENIQERDDILDITKSGKAVSRYRLTVPKEHELYETLRHTSDLYVLVEALKHHLHKNKPLHLGVDIFKLYHDSLCNNIFEILPNCKNKQNKKFTKVVAKFRDDFLKGNNLSEEVIIFRSVLQSSLKLKDDNQFEKELSPKRLNVSASFLPAPSLDISPNITNSEEFAKEFAHFIINAHERQENIITINHQGNKIIHSNISKLAFHILVQDETQKSLMKFNNFFFDDKHQLKGNLDEFKAALKTIIEEHGIVFGVLSQYKYKISEIELLCPKKKKLPSDVIEDATIEKFLENFVFAVNQPNEVELGKIITKEMGQFSKFNLLDANLVSDSFQRQMLDWFKEKRAEKGKEGVWLNAARGFSFVNSIEQKISVLTSVGICVAYSEKLAIYGIRFNVNIVMENLKAFLSKENTSLQVFHIITPKETILSAINVYSALEILKEREEFAQYNRNDSYIFIPLSMLLSDVTKRYVIDAFKSKDSHHFLIIDCKSVDSKSDIREICLNLSAIISQTGKKIILIANRDHPLLALFAKVFKSNVEDEASFADLTERSKEIILDKKVIFQGEKISFNKILNKSDEKTKEILDVATIVKLLKGEEISISHKISDLGKVNDYYIHRRFRPITFSKEMINKYLEKSNNKLDLFVISGTDGALKHNNIYVFDNAKLAEHKFNELCKQNTESNIHWLKSESKKLILCESYGSISNLISYGIKEKVYKSDNITKPSCLIEEENILHYDKHHKVVIISDTAGMGKSTVLTHLGIKFKEAFPNLWIIRIDLNKYTKVFNKNKEFKFSDKSINTIVEFLSKELLRDQSELEKRIFYNLFNQGKIAFLFDGFDEISPTYKDVVIDLLVSLKYSKVAKIIVTTRPHMREELEKALQVFSYELEPLSKEEQIEFLTKFWTKTLKLKRKGQIYVKKLEIYVKYIIESISKLINDQEQIFIGIPLQMMMVAEVFQENRTGMSSTWQSCKDFLESELKTPELLKKISLLNLYDHFVRRKFFDFYLHEKRGRDFTQEGEKELAEETYENSKKRHALLALHTLFSEKELIELLCPVQIQDLKYLIKKIKSGGYNEGIVDEIVDEKSIFIHRTFSEYFASFIVAEKMLVKPADTLQCINNLLLNVSPIFIHSIIEQLKGKQEKITSLLNKPLLYFVITENHLNFIKSLLELDYNDWPKKIDASGKTPLHYAIEYGQNNIFNTLLDYANDLRVHNIYMHGSFKNPEFKYCKLVKFINIQDNDGKTALQYAIRRNNTDFAFELLSKGASLDSLTNDDVNTLMNTMIHGDNSDNIYNNTILGVYANQDNKYRPIQEMLLLKAPGIFMQLHMKDKGRVLSYFFVHGRVEVIKALLGTITDLKERKEILNYDDNGYTPLDRVNNSYQLSDEDRLEVTKYLLDNASISIQHSYSCITEVLLVAVRHGHLKTFKYFIAKGNHDSYQLYLSKACYYGHLNIIEYLMKHYKENINKDGNTSLHIACKSRAVLKIIKYLINEDNINAVNQLGETPLHLAVAVMSELYIIEYLVNKGANINWEDLSGNTPLSRAVEIDQEDIIIYLIKNNAQISKNTCPVIKNKVDFFINYNQHNDDDENDYRSLHNAIKASNFEWVQFLVRHGTDINKTDMEGNTPLHWACLHKHIGSIQTVELLLQYGAIFDKKNDKDMTPRELFSEFHINDKIIFLLDLLSKLFSTRNLMQDLNKKILQSEPHKRLVDWGPYGQGIPDIWDVDNPLLFILNARNTQGKTLYHIAADTNDNVALHTLFKFNSDYIKQKERPVQLLPGMDLPRLDDYQSTSISIEDFQRNTPLHVAAKNGHCEIVNFLLENGAIFNSQNRQGHTPEVFAANNNHNNIVKLLQPIQNLFTAIEDNDNNTLEILHFNTRKAYINVKNQSGKTALHLAASTSQIIVMQSLLDSGANVEAIDGNKNLALHIAAEKGETQNVKLLLKYGSFYNAKNTQNHRPFDLAQGLIHDLLGQIDTLFNNLHSDNPTLGINILQTMNVQYEIDVSTIINIRDYQGNSLLHYAAKLCEFDIVKLLLENGAMYNIPNKIKQIPQDLTCDMDIYHLLKAIENIFKNVRNIHEERKRVSVNIVTNVHDANGKGLLYYAAKSCEWVIVHFLVENGAFINLMNIDYAEPKESDDLDRLKIIEYLIDNGDINVTNYKNETPLFVAINAQSGLNVIEYLVNKGCDVYCEDVLGNTPLSRAVETDQEDIINYLIKNKAHVSEKAPQLVKDKVALIYRS